jgi:microcystin-dependent protein
MLASTYAPNGWLTCDGQLVSIADYSVLYTLIGTTYGGNGQTNFALPDLRGRVPMGQGTGSGLSPRVVGSAFGTETVTLTAAMAGHQHSLQAAAIQGGLGTPAGNLLSEIPAASGSLYNTTASNVVALAPASVVSFGGSQPHENRMPLLCVTFVIAYVGVFPSQQ